MNNLAKMSKVEKFSIAGLKTLVGGSCAYGAYICNEIINHSGQINPIIAVVGIGLAASSGVLLKSTVEDVYSEFKKEEE